MIKLEDNYYIDADEKCFMLRKKGTNEKGKETIVTMGYFNTVQNAAKSYIKNVIRENVESSKVRSLHSLIKLVENLETKIDKILHI